MGNVLDAIAGAVTRTHPTGVGSGGEDRTAHMATRWALDSVIAGVVEAVALRSADDDGLDDLWTLVAEVPVACGDLSRPDIRREVTNWLLSDDRPRVERLLNETVGIDHTSLASLLESVVGVYLTHLRRRVALERLTATGLRKAVRDERAQTTSHVSVDLRIPEIDRAR